MNRRGFLRAVGATGLALLWRGPAVAKDSPDEPNEKLLRRALAERRFVTFKYHGHARRVGPHALGRVTDNRLALLGWQVSGGSASEPPPGWRIFVVAGMKKMKLARATFAPRPDYHPEKTKLQPIEVEVAPAISAGQQGKIMQLTGGGDPANSATRPGPRTKPKA